MKKFLLFFITAMCISCNEKTEVYTADISKTKQIDYAKLIDQNKNDIAGIYKIDNEESIAECDLTITFINTKKGYIFKLKSAKLDQSGKVSLKPTEDKKGFYFTLEGIEWSEYEGDISDEQQENSNDFELPIGIVGVISAGKIDIQNSGNAMNYYVQLADCDLKYIHMKRQ